VPREPQFYAVVELEEPLDSTRFGLRLLDFDEGTQPQRELWREFCEQAVRFLHNEQEIPFDPGYLTAQRGQILVSRGFSLPDRFVEDIREPTHCDKIRPDHINGRHVKAVVGAIEDENDGVERAIFKWLAGAKVIDQKTWMFFLKGDTLAKNNDTALVIPEPVHAVYQNDNLYFHSYDTVKKFIDMDVIYRDASRQEIEDFLNDSPVVFEGEDLYAFADVWSLRRISLIMRNPVWGQRSIEQICERAGAISLTVDRTEDGQSIVLPADKVRLRNVVRFLNQDICRTTITDDLIVTGDKLPYDQS